LVPKIQKIGSNVAIWGAYIKFPWSLVAILPSSAQPLWQNQLAKWQSSANNTSFA
jgi:hypothetical protein